jgi:hypothetical protein
VLIPSLYATSPLPLESLKDQLGFLVTTILGGDSFIHKNKRPRNQSRVAATPRSAERVRQDGDSTRDLRTKLGNCFFYYAMCCFFL